MSVPSRFADPQYQNWLKCASSLLILKESLHDYTRDGVRRLHDNVKHSVTTQLGSHYQCSDCSFRGIYQQKKSPFDWYIKCKKGICNVWLSEILNMHNEPQCKTINWRNADISNWSTDPWEIAKIYMTKGQWNNVNLPQELDSPALLSLLKYCKEFDPIDVQLVSKIIDTRNKVFHSTDLRVSDTDKDTWMDSMLLLVSDLNIQGVAYTDICKLRTEDIDVRFREQEIKVLQEMVSAIQNNQNTLKGDIDLLISMQGQCTKEIEEITEAVGYNETNILGLQAQNQQFENDLKGQKSQMKTYAQVNSTLKTFIDNNPDLSSIKILEELRATSNEFKALQKQLQIVESQLEHIKDKLSLIRADQEAMKTEMTIVKGEHEKMIVEHQGMKGEITGVKGEQKKIWVEHEVVKGEMRAVKSGQDKIRIEQEKIRNQLDEKLAEMQSPSLSTVNMQYLQKNLLQCYKFLNVIPISPLHESCTTLLDDIYTSVIIEKRGEEKSHKLQNKGQPTNSKKSVYLRSFHQLFGDKGNKRLILKGFMGSGKTVFCKKVVQTWCIVKTNQIDTESAGEREASSTRALDGEDILSQFEFLFFIDMAKVNSQEDLLHAIHRQCSIPNDTENKRFLCKLLQEVSEKILIILDGLDEMGSKTADFVNGLLERKLYPQITVLISTRPWQVSNLCLQAHANYDLLLDVQGFDDEGALDFATKVIHAHDNDVSDSLIKDMAESLKRKEIFTTFRSVPLLLLFLINVWYNDRSLPDQYSVLYSKIIDCMIKRCLNKTKQKHKNHSWFEMSDSRTKAMESSTFVKLFGSKFLELTGKLSYQFLLQRQLGTTDVISREKLLELLDEDEEIAESKLSVLLDCGILSKSDAFSPLERNYSVSFLHLSMQEFLAAVYLTLNEAVFKEFISSLTCLDDVLQNENLVSFTCGLAPSLGALIFNCICEICEHDSKVLEYRYNSFKCKHKYAIENLCSLYYICLNEVQISASLPLSDIKIKKSLTEKECEDFLHKIMTSGLTYAIKSFNLCHRRLLADSSASVCKIISNCSHLQSLVLRDVTIPSECSEFLSRSISNCTHLQTLALIKISLQESILDLNKMTNLTFLRMDTLTMSSECSISLCRSISACTHLHHLHLMKIELHDNIFDLSRLKGLAELTINNVDMSSQCSQSLCRSISDCTQLQNLHLRSIKLHFGILDLRRFTCLTYLTLRKVTTSSECIQSLCISIYNCTHLKNLHLEDIRLNDGILDFSRHTSLTNLKLRKVTMSSACSESLCRSISKHSNLQTLDLYTIKLHDSLLDLTRMTSLTYYKLCNVTMSSLNYFQLRDVTMSTECSESLCRSISNFTELKNLYLECITLHDGILDLSRQRCLSVFELRNVTMSSECSKSLCRSISSCTYMQNLVLRKITLHDSIPDLSKLTMLMYLKLHNVSMSSECSESICRNISNCTHLQNLVLTGISLHDGILDLSRLTDLNYIYITNVHMSSQCQQVLNTSTKAIPCLKMSSIKNVIISSIKVKSFK